MSQSVGKTFVGNKQVGRMFLGNRELKEVWFQSNRIWNISNGVELIYTFPEDVNLYMVNGVIMAGSRKTIPNNPLHLYTFNSGSFESVTNHIVDIDSFSSGLYSTIEDDDYGIVIFVPERGTKGYYTVDGKELLPISIPYNYLTMGTRGNGTHLLRHQNYIIIDNHYTVESGYAEQYYAILTGMSLSNFTKSKSLGELLIPFQSGLTKGPAGVYTINSSRGLIELDISTPYYVNASSGQLAYTANNYQRQLGYDLLINQIRDGRLSGTGNTIGYRPNINNKSLYTDDLIQFRSDKFISDDEFMYNFIYDPTTTSGKVYKATVGLLQTAEWTEIADCDVSIASKAGSPSIFHDIIIANDGIYFLGTNTYRQLFYLAF